MGSVICSIRSSSTRRGKRNSRRKCSYVSLLTVLLCLLLAIGSTTGFICIRRRRIQGKSAPSVCNHGGGSYLSGAMGQFEDADGVLPQRPRHRSFMDERQRDEWGIEYSYEQQQQQRNYQDGDNSDTRIFPSTVDAVAEDAFRAIAGCFCGTQRPDPHLVSNIMRKSILDYRPIVPYDLSRVGIEMDGLRYVLPEYNGPKPIQSSYSSDAEERALCRVSLVLGAKLAKESWGKGFEAQEAKTKGGRPVAIYYNSVRHAFLATSELQLLKRQELQHERWGREYSTRSDSIYENIQILCLGEDGIPKNMGLRRKKRGRRKKGVNARIGIVLVVGPTDHPRQHYAPAMEAINVIQALLMKATVAGLPSVILSPRLTNHAKSGRDQSVYQQSATFGGAEPPKGPTPWIMRDFTPPIYTWVGCGLRYETQQEETARVHASSPTSFPSIVRVVMTQSVMHADHAWHVYSTQTSRIPHSISSKAAAPARTTGEYNYMASTKTSSGRPTEQILKDIYETWAKSLFRI